MSSNEILRVEHIVQRFGGLTALNDINISVNKGEIISIIGPNGAGKTTLFNIISGINSPVSGHVYLCGQDIVGMKAYNVAKLGISRTFQNIRLFRNLTVLDNILTARHIQSNAGIFDALFRTRKMREEEARNLEEAEELLGFLDMSDDKYTIAASLPYGNQRKLEIARALATEPKLLLLDEPAAGMNENETEELARMIKKCQERGYTTLLIEHDMKFVMGISERVYVIDYGVQIASGIPEEIQNNPTVISAYIGGDIDEA